MLILSSPSRELIVGGGEVEEVVNNSCGGLEAVSVTPVVVVDGGGGGIRTSSNALASPIATTTKNTPMTVYVKDIDNIHSINNKDWRKKRRRKIFENNICTDERGAGGGDSRSVVSSGVEEEVDRFDDSISITSNSIISICSRSTCKSISDISKIKSLLDNKSSNISSLGELKKHNHSHHHHRSHSKNKHKSKSSRSKRKSHEKYIDQKIDDVEEEEEEKYDQVNGDCISSSFSKGGKRRRRRMTIVEDDVDNVSSITDISENNSRVDSRIIINRSDDEFTNNAQNSIILSNRGGDVGGGGDGGSVGVDGAGTGSGSNNDRNSSENNVINYKDRPELKEIISLTELHFNFDRKKYFDINSRTQRTWWHSIFLQDSEESDEKEQIFSLYNFLFSKEDYSFKQMPKSLVQFLEIKNNNAKEFEIKNKIRSSIINTVYSLFAYIKEHDSIMSVASVEEEFLIYIRNEFGSTLNTNFINTFSGKTSDLEPYLKHIVERDYRTYLKPKDPYDIVAWASCSTIDNAVKHISHIISKVITDFENILKNKKEEKTPIIYQQYIEYIIDMLNKEMSLSTKNIRSLLIQLAHSSELFTFILFGINKPNEDMLDRNNKIKSMEWPCGMFLNLALSISKVLVIQDTLKEVSSIPVENDDRREFMKNIYSKSVLFCVPLMMALGLEPTTKKNNISENDSRVIHNKVYSSFFDFCDQDLRYDL